MTDRYSKYKKLTFLRPSDNVLEIVLNGVGKGNACDHDAHAEMSSVWLDVAADPDVHCAIVRGPNDAFCSGGFAGGLGDFREDYNRVVLGWGEVRGIVYNMINCNKPIVSAVRGPAAGAGLAMALLADISITSETARINDAHSKIGMVAGDHAAIIWPLLCSMARAKLHLFLNDTLSGREAYELGLFSMCVPDEEVYDSARATAARLAASAQTPIRWTKYVMNNWLRANSTNFDLSASLATLSLLGPDNKEGMNAFREKRKPKFTTKSTI